MDELAAVAAQATGWRVQRVRGGLQVIYEDEDGRGRLFDIGEPEQVDPEDMEIEVDFGDVIWLVEVLVSAGDGETDLRLTQALTRAMDGVSCGDGGIDIWPGGDAELKDGGSVEVKRPWRMRRPAHQLGLHWFGLDRRGVCLPRVLFGHAVGPLAGLVPQYYYLGGSARDFAKGGVEQMCAALGRHRSEPSAMFHSSGQPFDWGFVSTSFGEAVAGGSWSMDVDAHAEAFRQAGMQSCLRELFTGVADETKAVYAYAEVTGGYRWNHEGTHRPESLWPFDWFSPKHYPSVWEGHDWDDGSETGFFGLTPRPTWWAWFGREYLPLVQDWLSHAPASWLVSDTDVGVLVQLASKPKTWAGLQGWVDRRRKTPWMPPELISWNANTPALVIPGR